jgi:hypothetical protein
VKHGIALLAISHKLARSLSFTWQLLDTDVSKGDQAAFAVILQSDHALPPRHPLVIVADFGKDYPLIFWVRVLPSAMISMVFQPFCR